MNKIPNRQVVCEVLTEQANTDKDILVLCSDSRGSAKMQPFVDAHPDQYIEVGIAEQNLVGISAGLAKCGKKPFVVSPASFLTTRSYEQCKVDVAYSNTNVKLIGISGGVSYGNLGMTHHSLQDISCMASIPNMRVYIPSDRFVTERLITELLLDNSPAYVRLGRNAIEDIYSSTEDIDFKMNKAIVHNYGNDVIVVACGELVKDAVEGAKELTEQGIGVTVLDMYSVKPLDVDTLLNVSQNSKLIVTVEEHSIYGGLGSMVSQVFSQNNKIPVVNMGFPDEPAISGSSPEVFSFYGLDKKGIIEKIIKNI